MGTRRGNAGRQLYPSACRALRSIVRRDTEREKGNSRSLRTAIGALSSRLFVSAFSAQKITNAIIRTIVASLFLAGGHIITLTLVAGGNRDNYGLYYCLTLPFTAISVAITLTGYFSTDFPLRQRGKEFTALYQHGRGNFL